MLLITSGVSNKLKRIIVLATTHWALIMYSKRIKINIVVLTPSVVGNKLKFYYRQQ